jgi:hypothetical protein
LLRGATARCGGPLRGALNFFFFRMYFNT